MTALVTATDLKRSYEMKQGWFRGKNIEPGTKIANLPPAARP